MRLSSAIGIIVLALLCQACAPTATWVPAAVGPTDINSVAFAKRQSPPGQAGYLDTIRYIDDGVRYLDPYAVFLVSPAGELCFRGAMEIGIRKLPNYYDYWCMTPAAVAEVDALDNDVSYIPEVQLWCRHASPYCARRVQYQEYLLSPGLGFSNTITVPVIPFKQEKGAIEHLVYLMGGDVHDPYGLDTRHVGDSVPALTR